jgi:WD40 repeat protein
VTGLHVGKPLELGGKALSAAFSPDGTRLLTATAGAARLWNATTDAPVGSAVMPSDEVQAVEFGTDGRHAVVVSGRWESGDQGLVGPSVVHALDAENGRVLMTLRLTSVAADFGIAAGKLWVASSNELQVWKLSDAGSTQPDRLAGAFRDASPDGRYFLLRDPDPAKSAAALWDSETGRKLDLLDVAKINWSSSSRFFVGASYRFLAIGDPSHGVSAPGKALWSYASAAFVSPKRTQVLLVGQNSSLLDLTTRKVQWTSSTPFSEVPMTAAWSESGARVFSWRGLSEARDIQVWDVARGLARQISLPLPPEHGISNAGVLDAQGRYIYVTVQKMLSNYSAPYSARDTDQLWIVDADAGVLVGKSSTPVVQYSEVKSDGERMFFRTGPSALALHSIVDNAKVAALEQPNVTAFGFVGRPARPFTLASAQGKFLSPGRFTVWNSNLSLPTMVVDDVVSVVPAPDKLQMAVIVDEGAAYAVDVLDGVGRRRLLTLPCTFATAEFSPDGRELLTICGLTAQLWDVRTGKQIGTSVRTRGLGGTPAFVGGGTRILIFPENGTLEVWDDKMGGPIGPAMPFSAADNLVVSDDGEYALIAPGYSGAGSRSLKVRALRTGIESQVGVDGPGVPAAANPDVWFSSTGPGLFLVKGGSGYEVPLPPRCQALIDWAWSVARNRHLALTPEQRKQFALPKSAERVRASGFMSFFGNLFWSPRVTCQ